jgi:ElaB/YqjD/DUF883 family membrane-anchored ribosome-binding protein
MAAEETVTSIPPNMDAELERSRLSAKRLLDAMANKVGGSKAAEYVKTHSAREMAAELAEAVEREPVYAIAAAVAAGFLIGCVLKRSLRPRVEFTLTRRLAAQ